MLSEAGPQAAGHRHTVVEELTCTEMEENSEFTHTVPNSSRVSESSRFGSYTGRVFLLSLSFLPVLFVLAKSASVRARERTVSSENTVLAVGSKWPLKSGVRPEAIACLGPSDQL